MDSVTAWPMTPKHFTLTCERREDGGLRVTCPEAPGLILSGRDPAEVMRDVLKGLDVISYNNVVNGRPK